MFQLLYLYIFFAKVVLAIIRNRHLCYSIISTEMYMMNVANFIFNNE